MVGLGGVDAGVSEQLGGDVDGKAGGYGFGDEHPAEVVCGCVDRLTCGVEEAGAVPRGLEQFVDVVGGDDVAAMVADPHDSGCPHGAR